MTAGIALHRRLLRIACVGAFLCAGGAGAPGGGHCPHHDGAAHHATDPGSASAAHPVHDSPPASGHPAGSADPCTCVGTCHASAATPVPVPGADAPVGPAIGHRPASWSLSSDGPQGPRHDLFELHRPNAPPLPG